MECRFHRFVDNRYSPFLYSPFAIHSEEPVPGMDRLFEGLVNGRYPPFLYRRFARPEDPLPRSFNEKFNRLLFNIDLSGNGLNGKEPKKPRGSQQLTNGDYEEHLEVCLAIASKNKQALAPLRERLQAKLHRQNW
ncbi:hypothetical protein IV203_002172 [Nitzschia inconspicua]|uniref:Uncharacterized protein n=1 Tax=Nitzschia inconspicua TaxID=303405 RepID=A0A9K3L7V8_9STRA|nr:hypothetical protein IV203_002172 [Nitzschia inconspicua]